MQGAENKIGGIEMRETLGTGISVSSVEPDWRCGTGGRASGPRKSALFGTHSVPYADLRLPTSDLRPPLSPARFDLAHRNPSPVRLSSPTSQPPAPAFPRGITLIEVLISMFVLAVGLTSVAALLPVAGFQVQRAQIDDRKAQVGPSAARDARNRAFLRPDYWLYPNRNLLVSPGSSSVNFGVLLNDKGKPLAGTNPLSEYAFPPIAIDPCMVKRFGTSVNVFATNGGASSYNGEAVIMLRTTLRGAIGPAADQICLSLDDLVFETAANTPDALPTNGFNSLKTKRAFEGRFSWLVTLQPLYGDALRHGDPPSSTKANPISPIAVNRNAMIMSTVVFNQRPTAIVPGSASGGERAAQATFTGTGFTGPATRIAQGIGAGELQLSDINTTATFDQATTDLAVKPGEWIMLGTMIYDMNAPSDSATSAPPPGARRPFFRWYRVVSAGPILAKGQGDNRTNAFARDLTISGADWQMLYVWPTVNQGGSTYPQFWAFIYDGAVAVYERTVQLEGPSMWSN
jgi:hypothetical protein